jgi:hypothetical protein
MAMKLHPNKGGSKEAFQKHVEMRNAALRDIRMRSKAKKLKKPAPRKLRRRGGARRKKSVQR